MTTTVKVVTVGTSGAFTEHVASDTLLTPGNIPLLDANGLIPSTMVSLGNLAVSASAASSATLAGGMLVYLSAAAEIDIADASLTNAPAQGYVLADTLPTTAAASGLIYFFGDDSEVTAITVGSIGKQLYLSTSGSVSTVASTTASVRQSVGFSDALSTLHFVPGEVVAIS